MLPEVSMSSELEGGGTTAFFVERARFPISCYLPLYPQLLMQMSVFGNAFLCFKILGLGRGKGGLRMAGDRLAQQYRLALRDLTFNSKPIINNLTMLAQENITNASTVVQALIDHFLTVLYSSFILTHFSLFPFILGLYTA